MINTTMPRCFLKYRVPGFPVVLEFEGQVNADGVLISREDLEGIDLPPFVARAQTSEALAMDIYSRLAIVFDTLLRVTIIDGDIETTFAGDSTYPSGWTL